MHIKELFLKKGLPFSLFYIRLLNTKQIEEKREFRKATRKTNPIHNDVSENTTFLLFDQPSRVSIRPPDLLDSEPQTCVYRIHPLGKIRVLFACPLVL